MHTLGIETSSDKSGVALLSDGELRGISYFEEGARHARDIIFYIQELLRKGGVGKSEVQRVAVSVGPGSFTGLRVGITCAKSLAYALGWEVVRICSLEVMAQNIDAENSSAEALCPVRDARRGAVYGRIFKTNGGRWEPYGDVIIDTPDRLADHLPEGTIVFGSGVRAYPRIFAVSRFHRPPDNQEVSRGCASAVAKLGDRYADTEAACSPIELVPKYYRLTEIEERIEKGGKR